MCCALTLAGCENLVQPQDTGAAATTAPARSASQAPARPPGASQSPALNPIEPTELKSRDDLANLVAHLSWLRSADPSQLQQLLPGAETRAKIPGRDVDRLRLAALLSVPRAAFRDEARARAITDEILRDRAHHSTETVIFAQMLRWDLQDRNALQTNCDQALAQEREQRGALKQKLNELKAIEEQIHRRETVDPRKVP